MINHDYLIDTSWCDSGGSCDFMPILGYSNLGFKSFKYKHKALAAYKIQKKLASLDLSPKVITQVCKIAYYFDPELLKYWSPTESTTDWGFVTEKADLLEENDIPYKKLQNLVDKINIKTNLKFWDCHLTNIGYIKRRGKRKLVCIDTGKESFMGYANAWGFEEPGPRCPYCNKFQCYCSYDEYE
jgi:hypothetical protein